MDADFSYRQEEFPWPERGDELFTSRGNLHYNACLNFTSDKMHLYATGYRTAAQLLVSQLIEQGGHQIDTLVYPIVFLYRHYTELRLKELIQEGCRLIDDDEPFPKDHQLDHLWRVCRQVIKKALPEDAKNSREVLEIMDKYIQQFAEIDNSSFAFRYPIKKDMSQALPDELKYINVEQFSSAMERVANFLDSVSMAISVYFDYKSEDLRYRAEIEAEYATEIRGIEAGFENEFQEYYT